MKKLAILGASGHGKVVADTAECCGWQVIEFFDDAWPQVSSIGVWSVVGNTSELLNRITEFDGVLVAIGNNGVRRSKIDELKALGAKLPVLAHPSSIISRYAKIGPGTVVFASAVVNAYASVGEGAILNTGCSVDHDCILGACVHISPGARLAGAVSVGDGSWIGIGACVRQVLQIGSNVMVGAGAAVVCNISDNMTVAGVPARAIVRS
ncbi:MULTISPECIES: acetyltransferase [Pseudomonas]|jgi:sugar O-acyltransferase (sialic acid O-acetyltransferase NeuD family)|uniref:Sugar O-acyltransferase, sialic acid O-acetyltransferase NeuD family n=1 Tax=Pseudomonas mandelii TaxID=75612 RepID=A0ABY0V9B0_9PSED|nr:MULTISPECIES: acetyltransferase [Pseudomonas]MDF9882258.1 sugar O-acyltransferase (sialic acid O-acetyltransferase NeuD family) [Pseudomonas silensiensis]QKG69434.1 acetyltransferase [Pseudomonas sp. B14-6]TWC20161.1 sugar O-acyltransferase (sialic acid O-acetyltransferase NeuD family) [Pseudomonas sp. SJZ083]TWC46944.1 sugar O-acyltransferase (sialic acid O-acetyltransferase NeuD family) [Pseudomonas sp. SJZ077]TWS10659.1 acetyltransferase [Pseudomonas mandelii]